MRRQEVFAGRSGAAVRGLCGENRMAMLRNLMAVLANVGSLIAVVWPGDPLRAQDWPTRPMTMVAPFAAGGSTDAIARIVADGLSSQLHQPVIVKNIGGAGGMTGANPVAKAA